MAYMGKVRPTIALLTDDIADDQVTSAKIADTTIVNADVNASAAIAQTKVALDITNSEVNASAAIAKTKLASLDVVNADVNASAAIVQSKLATLAITDSEVSDNALSGNKIDGGTISNFASTGIDDNASATSVTIDSTGAMNKTLQPAFFARNDTNVANATGDDTLYGPIIFDTEIFDQNADYDNSTGTFTAPITGRYSIQTQLSTGTQTASHTDGTFQVITSNGTYNTYYDPGAMEGSASTGQCSINASGLFDMDASDTVTIKIKIYGGTKTIDISATNTYFSGALIC